MSTYSPFTKEQLLPKEEKLAIEPKNSRFFIGLPKENHLQEKRICLTPDAVAALTALGHRVMIESNAGEGARYSDLDYSEAGAEVTKDRKKVFGCPVILKVEPPSIEEIELMQPQAVLVSALQLKTCQKEYFLTLAKKRITAIAFELIKDEDGSFPAVKASSEIAGTAAILIAAELMVSGPKRTHQLLGNISGVPPVDVVIFGAGTVGQYATRTALSMGATVKVFDSHPSKLRRLQDQFGPIFTSTMQPKNIAKALMRCDVAIGAVRGVNRAPIVVTEEMVERMKPGAIIIDVSIDMGGCIETSTVTSHQKPVFVKHDVMHYCVPNIPSRYSRTASRSISNIFTPYLIQISESGGLEHALRCNSNLKNGLYMYHGVLSNKMVADWFDIPYSDVNLLIF